MRSPSHTLCAHHAAVVASTIRAVPHLDPDERDRLADDSRSTVPAMYARPGARMSCTKRRYPDRVSADLALAVLRRKDSTRRGKQERRAYHCHACNGWHLTSMERR